MPRKVYTPQFKEQAVRLASAQGAVVEVVAAELRVATWTLRRWMKEQLGTSRKSPPAAMSPAAPNDADLHARFKQLEAENKRLRMERDILKKATAFFAAEDLAKKDEGGRP